MGGVESPGRVQHALLRVVQQQRVVHHAVARANVLQARSHINQYQGSVSFADARPARTPLAPPLPQFLQIEVQIQAVCWL